MSLLLVAFVTVLMASAVQAATGFGFALVAVPVLSLVADPRTAVVANGLAGLTLTIAVVVHERRHVHWRVVGPLLGTLTLGMPAGLLVLRVTPQRLLAAIIGTVVIICTALIWRGIQTPVTPLAVLGLGALAGALFTSTGANGPLLVAAFQAMGYEPRQFRATVTAIFGGCGIVGTAGFAITGQITSPVLGITLAGLPAAVIGWWAGNLLFHRLDPHQFQRLVLAALTASGAALLLRAVAG